MTFDLISGLVCKKRKLRKSYRFIYLRKILAKSSILTVENMAQQMQLCLPTETVFTPDIQAIRTRLYDSGYTLKKMDAIFDADQFICVYTLIHDLSSQLNHLAELALKTRKRTIAINSVERNIMLCMMGLFLPERPEDIQFVIGYGSYNAFHEWIVENLRTTYTIFSRIKPRNILDETDMIRIENQFKNICSLIERLIRMKGNSDFQLNFDYIEFDPEEG